MLDQHIGLVAFFLLIVLWVGLTVMKIKMVSDSSPARRTSARIGRPAGEMAERLKAHAWKACVR